MHLAKASIGTSWSHQGRSNSITTLQCLSDDLCFSAGVAPSAWGKSRALLCLLSATAQVQVTFFFFFKITTTLSSGVVITQAACMAANDKTFKKRKTGTV